ncbi:MAG: Fe-S cluster assembly protein SufD [Candidatus Aenigmarchaeota archaeon]|nr:Fe-S cluster assembly protein SufD [Candidatus Aenigmarchaeota archaeon]
MFTLEESTRIAASEPQWAAAKRKEAAIAFLSQPSPSEREEAWRYTLIDNFDINKSISSKSSIISHSPFVIKMEDALKQNKEVLDTIFREKKLNCDKFDFLNAAFWTSGYLVYIPENTNAGFIEIILQSGISRNFIIMGANSSAEILEHIAGGNGLNSNFTEVHAPKDAKLTVHSLHDVADDVNEFSYKRAYIGRNSTVNWNIGQFGGSLNRIKVENFFVGQGAHSQTVGVFSGAGKQHMDLSTNAFHSVPNTSNNIIIKGALKDSASEVYRGMIKIEKGAPSTSSYLSDHAIMLGENAVCNSIPSLMIDNSDVQCSHSASAGQVDEEKMLYMMSRGLSREQAETMIVEGFYVPIINAIPSHAVREKMMDMIRKRILS